MWDYRRQDQYNFFCGFVVQKQVSCIALSDCSLQFVADKTQVDVPKIHPPKLVFVSPSVFPSFRSMMLIVTWKPRSVVAYSPRLFRSKIEGTSRTAFAGESGPEVSGPELEDQRFFL